MHSTIPPVWETFGKVGRVPWWHFALEFALSIPPQRKCVSNIYKHIQASYKIIKREIDNLYERLVFIVIDSRARIDRRYIP